VRHAQTEHRPPAEGKFCDEHGKAQKLFILTHYSQHTVTSTKGTELVIVN